MILVDTCVVIWLAGSPSTLFRAAHSAIVKGRQSGGLAISGITLYELAWLAEHKKLPLESPVERFLAEVEANFLVLPITASIGRFAAAFSNGYPADPMDRIIGATALARGIPLVTRNKAIRRSKQIEVIW